MAVAGAAARPSWASLKQGAQAQACEHELAQEEGRAKRSFPSTQSSTTQVAGPRREPDEETHGKEGSATRKPISAGTWGWHRCCTCCPSSESRTSGRSVALRSPGAPTAAAQ